jgi:hypothetical protein
MTLKEFYEKIKSFSGDTMKFAITDVFSWRGSYDKPACSIECSLASKEYNLNMLSRLLNETFYGWKGGKYIYTEDDEIHFESSHGSYSDGRYILNFVANNPSEEVRHIFG